MVLPQCYFTEMSLCHFPTFSHSFSKTSYLMKHASWKIDSLQFCFKELIKWHFPYSSPHRFSNTSIIVTQEFPWKKHSPQCFSEFNMWSFPSTLQHVFNHCYWNLTLVEIVLHRQWFHRVCIWHIPHTSHTTWTTILHTHLYHTYTMYTIHKFTLHTSHVQHTFTMHMPQIYPPQIKRAPHSHSYTPSNSITSLNSNTAITKQITTPHTQHRHQTYTPYTKDRCHLLYT